MADSCEADDDYTANVLTALLCVGLAISYLPQHLRIIKAGSSEGFSPWFLLLGSTSSASGMLNIVVMQWDIVKCCTVVTFGGCIEGTAGIIQLMLQWFFFTLILVLYMIYYPPHLKYTDLDDTRHTKTDPWRLSITLSWVVFLHIAFITFLTFLLLATESQTPDHAGRSPQVMLWATFLGIASALLAALQYAPQLVHTYRLRLVGALSIPMMLIQSPGAVFMVLSIALRPGTNWTTWLPYAVAGVMQGSLLTMCVFWRMRQHRLHIDDFGNPLDALLPDDEAAVEDAIEGDIRADVDASEATPLLNAHSR